MNSSRQPSSDRPPVRPARQRPPSFAWQAALILLPVAVLTAVGLLSLRQDRLVAEQEARERAGRIAQTFVDLVVGALFENDPTPPSDTTIAPGIDLYRPMFEITPEAELVWPGPIPLPPNPRPLALSDLAPDARELWESALRASGAGDAAEEAKAWTDFLASEPPAEFAANAEYELAQAELRLGQTHQALSRFAQLAGTDPQAALESGLPIGSIAAWKAAELELLQTTDPVRRVTLLQRACSNLVFQPTALSPELLRRVEALAEPAGQDRGLAAPPSPPGALEVQSEPQRPLSFRAWWQLWETTQLARDLFTASREVWQRQKRFGTESGGAIEPVAPSAFAPIWVALPPPEAARATDAGCASASWLITRFPSSSWRFHGRTECEVTNLLARVRGQLPEWPPYFDVTITLAGRTFPAVSTRLFLAERVFSHSPQGGAGEPKLSVRVHLADAAALYARQRQRTWWFAAVVLAAATTAAVGLWTAHRAFRRQLRLNEMKSNFVSSVSHELRAPLASVRLLAESLDRGKVTDETRRRNYFRLIGQECRRLSALVENVLDFSRIDQGRQQYEFEPTDLAALVTHTVKLMESYAAERQVTLRCDSVPTTDRPPSLDGKAIQQALVNLVDNAIKHAPPGTTVTIALATSGTPRPTEDSTRPKTGVSPPATDHRSLITLSVTDQGPGIPPAEHARIFDPFYRRGSELRRETAGVGIGLTIVRHVVEAHGGRVRVESDAGKGSRFVMELPVA